MSSDLCIIERGICESGNTMARKRKKMPVKLPPLAVFLQDELENRPMTQAELSERSGIPDSTLSRIISGEVDEPKGSVVSQIARGLGMKFWELSAIMGITDDAPGTPEQEAAQIAALLAKDEALRPFLNRAIRYSPKNRAAVLAYMQMLDGHNDPPAPEEEL
jgi:transcriptional regulator with XRE-family HTH domain